MAYRMSQLPMTLSDCEGRFCCLKPFSSHSSINAVLSTISLHMNWKAKVACYFN